MARYSNVQTDFSGGLISEYILGRKDLKKTANSARVLKNFIPTLQGPATYRAGFERINTGDATLESAVSTELTLSTAFSYRIVFKSLSVDIYSVLDGSLKATLTAPYASGDLVDLRFSAETDSLYITHPNYPPKRIKPGFVQTYPLLYSTESTAPVTNKQLFSDDDSTGGNTVTAGDLALRASVDVLGDTNWNFEDIEFDVEPFLPPDETTTDFTITEGERYIKLTSSSSAFGSVTAGSYIEYQDEGEWLLGLVVDSTETTNYTILDPTVDVVYLKPVPSVLDINDPDARLFLLDNDEETAPTAPATTTNNRDILTQDGVPSGEIHIRSDVLVFRKGFEGSWLRVGDDRRAQEVAVGNDRQYTRWVRLKEHLGTQDHPVDFVRSLDPFTGLTQGTVYKFLSNATEVNTTYYVVGPDVNGNLDQTNGIIQVPGGNRVFSFVNGVSDANPHNNTWNGTNTSFTNVPLQVVANLSSQKQFDVVKCFDSSDSQYVKVEGGPSGNLISITSAVTAEIVANDATLIATNSAFGSADISVGRHFMLELPSGNVYVKCLSFVNSRELLVRLLNPVPRNSRDFQFENGGKAQEFRFGAWYESNYPRSVAKFEQRRVYGGTASHPNFLFFSEVESELDFRPTQNDKSVTDINAFTYDLSNRSAAITWMLALKDLVIGTTGGLYKVVPNQYQYGVSPKTARIELSEEEPCRGQGVIVGNSIFYPDSAGSRLLEYKFDTQVNNAASNDITKFIYPTFNNDPIKKIDYQHTPIPKIWVLTESGKLFCLTYHRIEEFYAWSEQDLGNDTVYDISVQPRTSAQDSDTVVVTVKRVDTTGTRYVFEKLDELKRVKALASATFNPAKKVVPYLDSHLSYAKDALGALTLTMVTDGYAVGDEVSVVVDGAYIGEYAIASESTFTGYTIPTSADNVIVGKKYTGEIKMMLPVWDGSNKPSYGSDNIRVVSARPFLIDSVKYSIGVDSMEQRTVGATTYSYGVDTFTGFDKEIPVPGSQFGVDKVPTIKQTEPYPLTIASITLKSDLS